MIHSLEFEPLLEDKAHRMAESLQTKAHHESGVDEASLVIRKETAIDASSPSIEKEKMLRNAPGSVQIRRVVSDELFEGVPTFFRPF